MNMETLRFCPQCQQPLPGNAPEGLCPQCLLKAGLQGGTEATVLTPQPGRRSPGRDAGSAMAGMRIGYVGDYELVEEIARGRRR